MAEARLLHLDVLRALALLGLALVCFGAWFAGAPLPADTPELASRAALSLVQSFASDKAAALLAFLFGITCYLQLRSYARQPGQPELRLAWRMLLLAGLGALHSLFWLGDGLVLFALLGLALIGVRRLDDDSLLPLGLALALGMPNLCWDLFAALEGLPPGADWLPGGSAGYLQAYGGSAGALLAYHWQALPWRLDHLFSSGLLSVTLGMGMLGLWVARHGWLDTPGQQRQALRLAVVAGIGAQAALLLVNMLLAVLSATLHWQPAMLPVFYRLVGHVHVLGMVAIYVAGLALLLESDVWRRRLAWLAAPGRLSLSVYLSLSCVGLLLFSGLGAALVRKTTPLLNLGLGLLVFGALALASHWWLQRYRYGPLEWAWRSASLGRALPWRR